MDDLFGQAWWRVVSLVVSSIRISGGASSVLWMRQRCIARMIPAFWSSVRETDVDFEVAEPGRLHQLIGGHRNHDAGFREIAGLQILHGIEGGAGAQGREHQLRRRHPGVIAFIFNWLVAKDRVGPRLNGKLYSFKMFDRYLHGSHYLS
jgi:hypothetical protein